ncbi:MAG: putative metalloprotease CJM1_0395 family protein [Desulforhopalus sp.]|nr:putative metalloprotease CJM1_0395 family protein [Desulforhopalus sp.]
MAGAGATNQQLAPRELEQLQQLRQRDREVRAHEQAHVAVAGHYARGGPSYTLQKGPDGNSYAVGGKVNVDLSRENTPQATLTKMQTIKRAALAPANPSPADRQVASRATQEITRAQREVAMERQAELLETSFRGGVDTPPALVNKAIPASGPGSAILQDRLAVYANIAGE